MSIEGAFLIWFIITFIAGAIFAVILWDTRTMIDGLKKDIDLLETQNVRLKDRLLELDAKLEQLKAAKNKRTRKKVCKLPAQCIECMKGGDAECDS